MYLLVLNRSFKLHVSVILLNLRPVLYILKQTALILNTCPIVRKFFVERWEKKVLGQWETYDFEDQLNCCEVRKVGIAGGDDDDNGEEEEEEDKLRSEILLRYVAETKYDSYQPSNLWPIIFRESKSRWGREMRQGDSDLLDVGCKMVCVWHLRTAEMQKVNSSRRRKYGS